MKKLLVIPTVLLAGCLASGIMEQNGGFDSSRFNLADRLSPTKFEQNATMKDTSVHEDPSLICIGVSRDQITNAFGKPNETSNQDGVVQDVYRVLLTSSGSCCGSRTRPQPTAGTTIRTIARCCRCVTKRDSPRCPRI